MSVSLREIEEPIIKVLWDIYNLGIRNGKNGQKENECVRKEIETAEANIKSLFPPQLTESDLPKKKEHNPNNTITEKHIIIGYNHCVDDCQALIGKCGGVSKNVEDIIEEYYAEINKLSDNDLWKFCRSEKPKEIMLKLATPTFSGEKEHQRIEEDNARQAKLLTTEQKEYCTCKEPKLANKLKCKLCGDVIESLYRHDFKMCKCGKIGVDGGEDYNRWIGEKENQIMYCMVCGKPIPAEKKECEHKIDKNLRVCKNCGEVVYYLPKPKPKPKNRVK